MAAVGKKVNLTEDTKYSFWRRQPQGIATFESKKVSLYRSPQSAGGHILDLLTKAEYDFVLGQYADNPIWIGLTTDKYP